MAGVRGGPPCAEDIKEVFFPDLGLFLRQLSRIIVIVKLPQLKVPGQSISNWDLMEKLKKAVHPIQLEAIRVRESSLEAVTFEAELNSRLNMHRVIHCLDGLSLKVAGFVDALRVRSSECKSDFPSRVDWDSHHQNHRKEKGHPDTLHLAMLPLNWFTDGKTDHPSERLLHQAMSAFGVVKQVDIPCCDPLRQFMSPDISGLAQKAYSFGVEILFEAFVQYADYGGFTNAMDKLRNMKWVKRMADGRLFYANVKVLVEVDFDRHFHLGAVKIARREAERRRILGERLRKEEEERKIRENEEQKKKDEFAEKEKKKEEKELKRKMKYELERRRLERKRLLEQRLEEEEREWAKRKKEEAKRLLTYLFLRIQARADRERHREIERLQEENLKEELKKASEKDIPLLQVTDECELRKNLLRQREASIRERLKEKLKAKLLPSTSGLIRADSSNGGIDSARASADRISREEQRSTVKSRERKDRSIVERSRSGEERERGRKRKDRKEVRKRLSDSELSSSSTVTYSSLSSDGRTSKYKWRRKKSTREIKEKDSIHSDVNVRKSKKRRKEL